MPAPTPLHLHYSYEYAVGAGQVRAIIDDYVRLESEEFAVAGVGFRLDDDERRRRHLIQSLLQAEGLDPEVYRSRFGAGVETRLRRGAGAPGGGGPAGA